MISYLKTVLGIVVAMAALFAVVHYGAGSILPPVAGTPSNASVPEQDKRLLDKRAPYFDLPNLSGSRTTLSDFENQPTLLVFWSTGNSEAADQIKILDDYVAKRTGDSLVKIVTISTQEEKSAVASFMRRGGYGATVLVDGSGSVGESYNIKNLPTLYFLDREGIVRSVHAGLMSEAAIATEVETILR